MDPFTIAALISGVGGGLGSLLGGINQSNATNFNNAQALQAAADAKKGSVDARGNRVVWDDKLGWVSTYGPTDQMLEDYFVTQEFPERSAQFKRTAQASRGEADIANALMDEFRRLDRGNPADIENLLFTAASRGINENTRESMEPAAMAMLRTGNQGGGNKLLEAIAREGQEALGTAGINAKLQALQYNDTKFNQDRAATTDLYSTYANRARADFSPTASPSSGAATLMSQFGNKPTTANIEADTGLADAFGGIGAAAGGIANAFGVQQQNNRTNALLESFLSAGGMGGMNNGGVLAGINERTRNKGSVF